MLKLREAVKRVLFRAFVAAGQGVGQVDAGSLLALERRSEIRQQRSNLQLRDDERRRQDLKAEHAPGGRFLQVGGQQRIATLVLQCRGDVSQRLDQVRARPAAGIKDHNVWAG